VEDIDEQELHVERVAALDLGKAALEACVRVPHESRPGRRMQEVRGYPTTTSALLAIGLVSLLGCDAGGDGIDQRLLVGRLLKMAARGPRHYLRPIGHARAEILTRSAPLVQQRHVDR
jgi:hypothetical protein